MRLPKAVTIVSLISTTRGNENSQRKMCDGLFLTLLLSRTSMSVSDTIVLTDEAKLNQAQHNALPCVLRPPFIPRKRSKPQRVYFSPSSDIFQPIPEVLELSHSILEFLLSNDIGIAFVTKGIIPGKTLELLLNHSDKVRAQIGIITYDDYVRSIFEPNAADIKTRLTQMAKLRDGGIAVEARIIPILPGITDDPSSIDCLCAVISNTGVKQAAISTLFLKTRHHNIIKTTHFK